MGDKALKTDLARIDPSRIPEGITRIPDISYADDDDPGHKFDVYLRRDGKRKPVLIDIHGGGFISEDKAMNRMFGSFMADMGFVVFELNVRLAYPEYTVFDQIGDIDLGVRFVLDNAVRYEGDTERLYISGHSSGAVLAVSECLLSEVPGIISDFGLKPRDYRYKGIITDCGLLHFYKTSIAYWGMRKMVFPKNYKKDKRYGYLVFDNNEYLNRLPRAAVITNRKDVLKKMTYHFDEVLARKGAEHRLFHYGPDGHTGIIFKPYTPENKAALQEIIDYLDIQVP